jgi:hypothetical protein
VVWVRHTGEVFQVAHVWFRQTGGASHWTAGLLETAACRLSGNQDGSVRIDPAQLVEEPSVRPERARRTEPQTTSAWLTRHDDLGREERWILLAATHAGETVRCNGMPLTAGLRILRDRDEIRLPGCEPVYFSTERLCRVVPYPAHEKPVICPRCRQPLAGTAVQCPNVHCGAWHHQSAELPCWTGYVDEGRPFATCALCNRPTTLYPEAEFVWTPEGL